MLFPLTTLYCVPNAGDGNTNATTVRESTAFPFLFAGINPHVFTAVIADPVNAATPCTTFTLFTSPPLPILTSSTTVPNAVEFGGYVAYVADATRAGMYGALPTSAAAPNCALGNPTPAGLNGLNTAVTCMLDGAPLPFAVPAANDHPRTAVCAALVNGGTSLTTCTFWIFAFPSRFNCSVTNPGELAFTGYATSPALTSFGATNFPPFCAFAAAAFSAATTATAHITFNSRFISFLDYHARDNIIPLFSRKASSQFPHLWSAAARRRFLNAR